jgi:CubicO group peptidase (beta-lactamase class C family)
MKTVKIFLLFLVSLTSLVKAQNLSGEFNVIANNNDMMGGTLVVFCEDGIIENIAIGKSDHARNINSSINTKYRVASISKTITAIAIMQLVEQNLLDLDADISTILGYGVQNPNHPTSPITTRMLLSHTSSIIDGTTYSSFMDATINEDTIPNLSEILTPSGAFYTTGQFNSTIPGTYFNYANINYVILGTIVEKISNLRFDIYCKQNISDPLGIDASFNVNDLTDINQLAVLYRKINGVWTPQADNYLGTQPIFSNLNGYIPGTNGGRFGPQGGFRCSGQDLAKIFLVLMNKGSFNGHTLLSESSCSAMFANAWTFNGNNGNNYYGLFRSWGLGIHRITSTPGNDLALPGSASMLGHSGEAYGLVSDAYFDTTRKVGFVFMNNGVGIGYQTNNNSAFYTIEQEVFAAIENHGNIMNCQLSSGLNPIQEAFNIIYPNPTDGLVKIEIQNQSIKHVEIYDLPGKLIKETSDDHFDLSDCLNGTYFVKVQTDKGFYFSKLLKH